MLQSDLIDLSVNVHALTNPQLLQVVLELWFLLQHLQQVGGLHALQLHFVVDVDFVVEADVNQAGSVLPILTGILTCTETKKSAYNPKRDANSNELWQLHAANREGYLFS